MNKKPQSTLSESLLRATLYSIGDAVIATDTRGKVTLMNHVAEKLTGWKEREARSKALSTVFRIINEETRKKVESPVARVLREGIVVGLANHTILISRKGKEIPIADAGAPIKDESGKVVGVVLVFRDQTAERAAQRAVQDAREFAENIIATVREPLLVLDETLEVVAANRSFYNVFEVKPEETIGKKVYRLGNGQWNIPALRKLLEDILPSNSHFDDYEVTHDFEHIGRRTMLLNARRLFREANRSKLILLAIEDITERKQAELQLRQILHNTTNLFYSHTPDHVLTYVSPQSKDFLGCDPAEAKRRWTEFATDHPVNQIGYELTEATIKTGKPQPPYELQLKKKTGEIIWVEVREVPVVERGKVTAIVGSLTDITKRKRAEEENRLLLTLVQAISVAEDFDSALGVALRMVCETTAWEFGEAWIPSWDRKYLEPSPSWYCKVEAGETFRRASERFTFAPGVGLPGRVWSFKKPAWIPDVTVDPNFPRAPFAKEVGFNAAVGIPILAENDVVAVMEFFLREVRQEDERMVALISAVAAQLGTLFQRKRAEEALKESEERYHRISDLTSDYAYAFRVEDGNYLIREWVTDSFTRITGSTPQEVDERGGWPSLIHPDDMPIALARAQRLFSGEDDVSEYRIIRKDGQSRWLRDHGHPVWDDKQQRVVRIYGAAQDITEQKNAEQAVREREEWFRRLADTTSTAIFIYQGERFVYVNKATEELSGYTNQELLSLRFWDVVHPDFRELVRERGLALQRGEAVPNRYEFQIVRKDGTVRWIDFTAGKIDWQGQPAAIGTAFDITERRLVEETLRENEQRYRSIVENINQAYYEADRRGAFTYCNPGLLIISGYTAEELLGRISYRLIAEEDRRTVIAQYEEWLKEKRTDMAMEFRVKTKSGRMFWVEVVTHFEFDKQGTFVKATNVLRDIDERKRAEEELQRSHEWLNSIFEASRDGIIVEDNEQIVYVNRAAVQLYGYSDPNELIGRHVSLLQSEEDNERMLEYGRKRKRGEPAPTQYEFKGRRKDGSFFDCEMSVSRTTIGDQTLIIGVLRDITDRKRVEQEILQSRQRYERFFMEDLTGDFISAPDGRLFACNPAFVRIFGFVSEEEALNTNVVSLYRTPEERQRLLSLLQRERKLEYYEMQMRKRDGTPLHIIANIIGRFDGQDRLVEIQGYLFDDTKRRQLEEQLHHAQKLQSIGTLASGIAHDFNNILAIIMGHASLLELLHDDREKLAKRAATILKATERGALLVKQLLTFARKAETVLEPLSVNLLLREMARMLRETFPRDIDLRLQLEEDLPSIIVDANQFHQVVLNLCVNARDAMPNGGTLTIATSHVEAEALRHRFPNVAAREYLALTITDTGVGIDNQVRDRIFEPFFTTKAPGHGTGLGLAVVHGIVTSHGGFIDFESEVGKGTTFSLYFPIPESPVQLLNAAGEERETVRGGTETILLVEDEEMLRTMLVTLLESKGYRVLTACDGEDGIELYQRHRQEIQLVLSDFGLPKMNGAEFFRRVRALDPHKRVILASGFFEPQLRADLEHQGVTHLLSKPYRAGTVLSVVRKVLDNPE